MRVLDEREFVLDRRRAVPALIGDPTGILFVTGLAGASKDIAAVTGDGANHFAMGGGMGLAASAGLGLALAQPERLVLVATGDAELLMNVGSLAVVALAAPSNLAILCIDNGHNLETGGQPSHTSYGTDIEAIARGCGLTHTCTVRVEAELAAGAAVIRNGAGPRLVVLRVAPTPPPAIKRLMDPAACRIRFRHQTLGVFA